MVQDVVVQPGKLGARIQPGLVGEHLPGVPVRRQRAGDVADAVERGQQLGPRPLPGRMPLR